MRVLLIKTSSMGDVIHTLPALSDAMQAIPGIQFDWVVERAFLDIPGWHPAVQKSIPVQLRRWRKVPFAKETRLAFRAFRENLKQQQYDIILDAQGLMKSAFLGWFVTGERVGLDFRSARESMAALFYHRRCRVNFYQHAVTRMRLLLSEALRYPLPNTPPNFYLKRAHFQSADSAKENYLVLLHSTTWSSKQWPESYWRRLAKIAGEKN